MQATTGGTSSDGARSEGLLGRVSLPWRVFLGNSLVLGIAIVLLAATPVRVQVPSALEEAVVLVAGITAILLTNLVLLRRAFAPLNRLTALMRNVEPLEPGRRIPVYGDDEEVVELTRAFNDMLARGLAPYRGGRVFARGRDPHAPGRWRPRPGARYMIAHTAASLVGHTQGVAIGISRSGEAEPASGGGVSA